MKSAPGPSLAASGMLTRRAKGSPPLPDAGALRTKGFSLHPQFRSLTAGPMGSPGAAQRNPRAAAGKTRARYVSSAPLPTWRRQSHKSSGWCKCIATKRKEKVVLHDLAFGKRQSEELYDLEQRPRHGSQRIQQLKIRKGQSTWMSADLMKKLKRSRVRPCASATT